MTTTLLLIRHASHGLLGRILCGRTTDVDLSDQGRNEARRLAETLARRGAVDALYTSPLTRARATAGPLAKALDLHATVEESLTEIDFGEWSGRAFEDLAPDPRWTCWNRDRDHARPPNGESMGEAQSRVVSALDVIAGRHRDGTVALVSHADIIKAALAWALGLSLGFYSRFEISPASVSRMTLGALGARVWSINEDMTG